MFLELVNDLFVNSSIFYFYFGAVLATIGVSQLIRFSYYGLSARYELALNKNRNIKVDHRYVHQKVILNESFIVWFVKNFKRIDQPDDDKEDNLASYFNYVLKIRGGLLWKRTLHDSPALKSTVLSYYYLV